MTKSFEKWVSVHPETKEGWYKGWENVHPLSSKTAHFWLCALVAEVRKRYSKDDPGTRGYGNAWTGHYFNEIVREFGLDLWQIVPPEAEERTHMKPSEKAIEAAKLAHRKGLFGGQTEAALEAAYAIDVYPLERENRVLEESLRQALLIGKAKLAERDQEIERLMRLETALRDDLQRGIELTVTQNQRIAFLELEIVWLQGDLGVVRKIDDTFWAALKLLKLPSIYVTNPGLHFTERIAALEAENTKLRESCDQCIWCGKQQEKLSPAR